MGFLPAIIMICAAAAGATPAVPSAADSAKPAEKSVSLKLRNADFNENFMQGGKLISVFKGNVTFEYDSIIIKSDNARMHKDDGVITLNDRVSVTKKNQVLTCDKMTFYKKDNLAVGSGKVNYIDGKNHVRLTGSEGRYELKRKELTVTGNPQFFQYDTAAAETLKITSKQMIYNDSSGIATAKDQVVITKTELRATCKRAHYFTKKELAHLRGDPHITYDINNLDGDSVNLYFDSSALSGISVQGHSRGKYREVTKGDTSLTDIQSDSMYMDLTANGRLDTIWAIRNVVSTNYQHLKSDTANQIFGRNMILAFNKKGDLDRATVWGNARSTYYIVEDDGQGRNEASGDSILVSFLDGKASNLTLAGSVRGKYYPQKSK